MPDTKLRLPSVKEGVERQFHSTTPAARADSAPLAVPADELTLVINSELAGPAQSQTSANVGEPSAAINGNVVFYTGNWYAAMSSDGGKTFLYVDPRTTQQGSDPAGVTFCCDQIVHYIPSIDTFVWLLQYGPKEGNNIQRLGFATTAQVVNSDWHFFDITTDTLGVPGAFMDFPDLAVGANALYVTTNVFTKDNRFGAAVFRIPIDGIASRQVTVDRYVSIPLFSGFRVAQHCGTTAYFAAHEDTSTLAVYTWKEDEAAPSPTSVPVARWIDGNGYYSWTPDGRRWLDRADSRITGATVAGDELWFAWSVDRGSNQRPWPFIQIARITAPGMQIEENINVFDTKNATCYPALSSNGRNEVGISYMMGGQTMCPSHVVGILTNNRRDVIVAKGDRSPVAEADGTFQWGDYLAVRRALPGGNT